MMMSLVIAAVRTRILIGACTLSMALVACTTASAQSVETDQMNEIRKEFQELETAWNTGDLATVVSKYHASVFILVQKEKWGYEKEVAFLTELMNREDRATLSLRVDYVRPLGPAYALVNGAYSLIGTDGKDQGGPFTGVWLRTTDGWKCIYSHS